MPLLFLVCELYLVQRQWSTGSVIRCRPTSSLYFSFGESFGSELCFQSFVSHNKHTHITTTTTYKPRLPPKRQTVFAVISLLWDPSSENHRNIHISTTTLTTEANQPWPSVQNHSTHPHQLGHLREKQDSTESSRM